MSENQMDLRERAARACEAGSRGSREGSFSTTDFTRLRLDGEIDRVLAAFVDGGRYHRFQAARELHDRALHSTVSTLSNVYGIEFAREPTMVPGYGGAPTRVVSYWLPPASVERPRRHLGLDT